LAFIVNSDVFFLLTGFEHICILSYGRWDWQIRQR